MKDIRILTMEHRSWGWCTGLALLFLTETGAAIAQSTTPHESYLIGINDVVRIQVFGEEDLTVENKIDGEGNINLPLLGIVQVAGKTVHELQEFLTIRLAAGYVRNPKVSAYVVRHRNFYLNGEVKTPGGYPHEEGMSVQKAISLAGGLTEKAERGTFQVLRRITGHEETVAVGLDGLVLPDDIIVVAEGRRVYVSGEVKAPGRYLYEKGMTIHKALSLAGGWTEKADRGTIKVTRMTDGVAHLIDIALDAPVLPDDFIVVPQVKKVYVNGEVKRAGDYPYERDLTVHKVITMAGGFTDKAAEGSTKVLRKINGQEQPIQVNLETIVLPEDILVVPRSFF